MKKCPKCGFKNTDDSAFCENCGTKLDPPLKQEHITTVSQNNSKRNKKDHKLIIALSVVIVILLAIILFMVGSHSSNNANNNSQSTIGNSVKKQSRSTSSASSKPKLDPNSMDEKVKIAAIIYYGSGNKIKSWEPLSIYEQHGGSAAKLDSDPRYYKKGSDPITIHVKGLGKGGMEYFTTDGDNVYLYHMDGAPSEGETPEEIIEESSNPQASTTWSDIADYVNRHNGYQEVEDLANNIDINDN